MCWRLLDRTATFTVDMSLWSSPTSFAVSLRKRTSTLLWWRRLTPPSTDSGTLKMWVKPYAHLSCTCTWSCTCTCLPVWWCILVLDRVLFSFSWSLCISVEPDWRVHWIDWDSQRPLCPHERTHTSLYTVHVGSTEEIQVRSRWCHTRYVYIYIYTCILPWQRISSANNQTYDTCIRILEFFSEKNSRIRIQVS